MKRFKSLLLLALLAMPVLTLSTGCSFDADDDGVEGQIGE